MSSVPNIAPPHPNPRSPSFRLPPGSCDCHCHIFGPVSLYPYASDRPYTPPEAPLEMLRALHMRIGVERAIIVNTKAHGRDNRVIVDAIAQSQGRYKGVANIDETFTDRELAELAASGVVAARFTFLPRLGSMPDAGMFDTILRRISVLGWHASLYLPAHLIPELRRQLTLQPAPYVIEHMGMVDVSLGVDQPGFLALLSLFRDDEKCWIKLTSPDRTSRCGPPYHDAAPFARALIAIAPDRVLWGTDWPHPNVQTMPDDGDLVDLVPFYAPEPELRQKLFVDNPVRLYKFVG